MTKLRWFFLATIVIFCVSCHLTKNQQQPVETMVVAKKANVKTLYYNSVVRPLRVYPIISKVDGFINKIFFRYGTVVSKDQLLFVIASPQLVTDYQSSLADYLKALRDFGDNEQRMIGAEALKKQGIISDQEYRSTQTQYFYSQLSLAQAKHKFEDILIKMDIPLALLQKIDVNNMVEVNAMLNKASETLKIYAPDTGVALAPEKSTSSGGSSATMITTGSAVKTGDNLLTIGNMGGISFDIKVSEIDIDSITLGQVATITGDGFPGIVLKGYVYYKERQPVTGDSSGMTTYVVHVIVPKITELQTAKVRNGMSAKVEVPITLPPVIEVPISAVFTKDGKPMVKILDQNKKIISVSVKTGQTSPDSIEIQQGLKPGDVIIIDPQETSS